MDEKTRYRNGRCRWTVAELTCLEAHYRTMSLHELALILGRTPVAIRLMACKLACQRDVPRWTAREDEILLRYYAEGAGVAFIQTLLKGKSTAAIFSRAAVLGVTSGRNWRKDELNILKMHYPEMGSKVAELLPGRTRNAVAVAARRMKLRIADDSHVGSRPRREEEWALLAKNMHLSAAEQQARLFPGRTKKAVEKARWCLRKRARENHQ